MRTHILIADDDTALAANLAEIVQALDARVTVVSTAGEALSCAQNETVEVALVDLRLPDGSGGHLVRALRQQSPYTQTILITGDATVETAAQAVSDGAFAYVLKPFEPLQLLDMVRRASEQAQLFREKERLRMDLENSEKRHREVVEAVPALVLALDDEGLITLWNRRLEELTGFDRKAMLGKPGPALSAISQSRDAPAPLATKQGNYRQVRWQTARLPGPVTYAVGIDVTEEDRMLRRTLRAERLAAVGTMAAGLAHEIRNPLNAALLQLTLLSRRLEKDTFDKAAFSEGTDIIRQEIQRLERLVGDFLAFARPKELAMAPVQVDDLCRSVMLLIGPEADEKKVRTDLSFDPLAPAVEADAERLKQVLLNLLRNALEATPEGGSIFLRTRPSALGVEVEVEDSGAGISDETAIFDAFYTTKPEGTGLGLALVHRIVADHGGNISVSSRPGCTRFVFTLPSVER